mmetsp:Transcript_77707/g.225511  ORF Transcript_77707/g.225511 Transcript_77707/m.225511 type:complete len:603 (-) Transcript_77707:580-2388(-)
MCGLGRRRDLVLCLPMPRRGFGEGGLRLPQAIDVLGPARRNFGPCLLRLAGHRPSQRQLLEQRPDRRLRRLHLAVGDWPVLGLFEVLHKRHAGLDEARDGARRVFPGLLRLLLHARDRGLELLPRALALCARHLCVAPRRNSRLAFALRQVLVLEVLYLRLPDGRRIQRGRHFVEGPFGGTQPGKMHVDRATHPLAFRAAIQVPRCVEQPVHLAGDFRQRFLGNSGHRPGVLSGAHEAFRGLVREHFRGLRFHLGLLGALQRLKRLLQLHLGGPVRGPCSPQPARGLFDGFLSSNASRGVPCDLCRCLGNVLLCGVALLLHDFVCLGDLLRALRRGVQLLLRFRDVLFHAVRGRFLRARVVPCKIRKVARASGEPVAQPAVFGRAVLVRRLSNRRLTGGAAVLQEQPRLALGRIGHLEQGTNLLGREQVRLLFVLKRRLGQPHLEHLQPKHLVLDQAACHQPVHLDLTILANSVGAVHSLRVRRRIPRRVDHDDAIRTGEVQSDAAYTRGQEHALEAVALLLELGDLLRSGSGVRLTVDAEAAQAVRLEHTDLHKVQHADALGEDKSPVAPFCQRWQQQCHATQLRALREHRVRGTWQPARH